MFEIPHLSGTPEREIALETRLGNRIANSQLPEPGAHSIAQHATLLSMRPEWEPRKPACGVYNCFGHVWAARRTGIFEDSQVRQILSDDGYRRISSEHSVQGDIVLYYDQPGSEVLHAGVITELRFLAGPDVNPVGRPVPWVLSKLGPAFGEVLHRLADSPCGGNEIEVWTDR